MRRLFMTVAVAAMFATAAHAEMRDITKSGDWLAFRSEEHCGMRTIVGDVLTNTSGAIMVKFDRGQSQIYMHLFFEQWEFPTKENVNISVKIDGFYHHLVGQTYADDNPAENVNLIEIPIAPESTDIFLNQFALGKTIEVHFPADRDLGADWLASLNGSSLITHVFNKCVANMGGLSPVTGSTERAKEPYGPPAPPAMGGPGEAGIGHQ